MPANTSNADESNIGKHIAVVLTIGLVLALNSVALGGLLLYCGGAMAIAYFLGCFSPDYVPLPVRLINWAEARLAGAVSRQIAV